MALGVSPFGNFAEKIKTAIELARSRNADAAIAAATAPAPTPPVQVTTQDAAQGDGVVLPIVFPALGDQLALARPPGRRTLLVVINTLAANPVNVNFGVAADNVAGIPIPVGGNLFLDVAVPQNDVHIFAPVAGTVLVFFINTN